jgi:hypothetical protein
LCKMVEATPVNTNNSTTQTMVKTKTKPTRRCVANFEIFMAKLSFHG